MNMEQHKAGYRIESTTADGGFTVWAPDQAGLFEQAGIALLSFMTDINRIKAHKYFEVRLSAETIEDLLVQWLNELIYLIDVHTIFFSSFSICEANAEKIVAKVGGETINPRKHLLLAEVKAATYHNLVVTREANSFQATVILDL